MSSASRGLAPREGLDSLLMKMGRAGLPAKPRRGPQAGKSGYPGSKKLAVALRPKAHSDLASRRSQRARAKRRGPQSPADRADAWRLMGHGRLHFPMLPRQLPDLTSPCCMQKGLSLPAIVEAGGWPPSGYKWGEGQIPRRPSLPITLDSSPLFHF